MCPFADHYDADLHEFLANLRRIDGSLPPHLQYGVLWTTGKSFRSKMDPQILGTRVIQSWGESIAFILYTHYVHCSHFFWLQIFSYLGP